MPQHALISKLKSKNSSVYTKFFEKLIKKIGSTHMNPHSIEVQAKVYINHYMLYKAVSNLHTHDIERILSITGEKTSITGQPVEELERAS